MKHYMLVIVVAMGLSFPVLAADQQPETSQPETSQPNTSQPAYQPSLADIMVATQLRHFKLWYAGEVANWGLADYELTQIRATIREARRLYPNLPKADMTSMMAPTDEVRRAIGSKDSTEFAKAYNRLTVECNTCHQAAGLGFITIREPRLSPLETSPFSDESFFPK
ncbi:MAG TPA: hypothetical protein VGH40_22685 [Roseiarcus sp.]|jgi:hypothetical protein